MNKKLTDNDTIKAIIIKNGVDHGEGTHIIMAKAHLEDALSWLDVSDPENFKDEFQSHIEHALDYINGLIDDAEMPNRDR